MIIKIKKYIASFIVLSYFALSVANVTHYHHIAINTNLSENVSEFQLVQKIFNHSFFECPIHNAFNSLHNLTNLDFAYSSLIFLEVEDISVNSTQSFPSYLVYHSIALRAPPELLS